MTRRISRGKGPRKSTSDARRLDEIFDQLERERMKRGMEVTWATPEPQLEGADHE